MPILAIRSRWFMTIFMIAPTPPMVIAASGISTQIPSASDASNGTKHQVECHFCDPLNLSQPVRSGDLSDASTPPGRNIGIDAHADLGHSFAMVDDRLHDRE